MSNEAWLRAYMQWKVTRSPFAKGIINNMDDYYSGLSRLKNDTQKWMGLVLNLTKQRLMAATWISVMIGMRSMAMLNRCTMQLSRINGAPSDDGVNMWDLNEDSTIVVRNSLSPCVCPSAAVSKDRIEHILADVRSFYVLQGAARKTAPAAMISLAKCGGEQDI